MFKMFSSAILTVILAANLSGAELKTAKNRIQSGPTDFYLNSGCFSVINQKQQILSVYPHFTTGGKDKWYSLVSRKVSSKLLSKENNCWKFQSSIPLNAAAEVLNVAATVTVTPSNTIESEVSWEKPANAADLKDSACFFGLPLKNGQNKQIMLNGQEIQILNETKYGWFAKTMENPIFILYPGIEGKEMTLAFSGKVGVVMGSVKDANVTIRISFRESPIRFTITPK